jgi:Domain of unknown function (DUF6434)/SAP domain-containing new25
MMRPNLLDIQTSEEFQKWYWLKAELVVFCQLTDISYAGSKFEIIDRIVEMFDVGVNNAKKIQKVTSKFDWHCEDLTLETRITDSYKNSRNVRRFFKKHCGEKFHFNIAFMNWMKNNVGKTLAEAVEEWKRLDEQSQQKGFKSEIPKGNQYNQYLRDFFADNPDKTMIEARHFWKLKRELPLGLHKYERTDLELK